MTDRPFGDVRESGQLRGRLVVHHQFRWMVLPGGSVIDFARYKLLRRLLAVLADARVQRPGEPLAAADLVAAGWPDERILPRAARNRVHVALSRLRRLGLDTWLVHVPDGWLLASSLSVEISEAPIPPAGSST